MRMCEFDAYPMPRVDKLIERLGLARYLTTLDLTRGTGRCHYWQVPHRQGEDSVYDPKGVVPVHCPPLRRPQSPGYLPEDDGSTPAAAPGLRRCLHR